MYVDAVCLCMCVASAAQALIKSITAQCVMGAAVL